MVPGLELHSVLERALRRLVERGVAGFSGTLLVGKPKKHQALRVEWIGGDPCLELGRQRSSVPHRKAVQQARGRSP